MYVSGSEILRQAWWPFFPFLKTETSIAAKLYFHFRFNITNNEIPLFSENPKFYQIIVKMFDFKP